MTTFLVAPEDTGTRLDVILAKRSDVRSRSEAQRLITAGRVLIGRRVARKNTHVSPGDEIVYSLPSSAAETVEAEALDIDVVYEDDDIIVVCKQAGMVVHPAAGHISGTLVNALLARTRLAAAGAPLRPGIVHRLDKDTSGLMVVAKNDEAYMALVNMIKKREVSRTYKALVKGLIAEPTGIIEASLGRLSWDRKRMGVEAIRSKPAKTTFEVLRRSEKYTLVKASLVTGRTHQIRAHFAFIGHPVVGDPTYGVTGKELGLRRQFLHAHELAFKHPRTEKNMRFSCSLPEDLRESEKKISWRD